MAENGPKKNAAIEWLRELASQIPESPNRLSILNMLRAGSNSALNWLDATNRATQGYDPRGALEDGDVLAPLGLAGMGAPFAVRGALGSAGGRLAKSASELPMDEASRLARAREMGFDTDTTWYHATHRDFDEFDLRSAGSGANAGNVEKAVFLTDDPVVADTYLGKQWVRADNPANDPYIGSVEDGVKTIYSEGARVMPVRVRGSDKFDEWDMGGGAYDPSFIKKAIRDARKERLAGVIFRNLRDPGISSLGRPRSSTITAVFNPKNIRSVNAAFDPSKSDSANLLAAETARSSLPGTVINADEKKDRKKYATGGAVKTGPLISDVPGRTDQHAIDAPEGAFIIPADVVSGLGEGNTMAGVKILENLFPKPLKAGKIKRHSEIPAPSPKGRSVPIAAAGGEYIIDPETVAEIGGGDLEKGHRTLDEFVMRVRQNTIKEMASLPPPHK